MPRGFEPPTAPVRPGRGGKCIKSNISFYRLFNRFVFYGGMHSADAGSPQTVTWFVEADPIVAPAPRAARLAWADRETSLRAVIASSFFLVLLAGTMLLGGHAAIDPLLRLAITARDGRAIGDVVMRMPDGKFCRHLSFDNDTAEMIEGDVERCPDNFIAGEHFRSVSSFTWGGH